MSFSLHTFIHALCVSIGSEVLDVLLYESYTVYLSENLFLRQAETILLPALYTEDQGTNLGQSKWNLWRKNTIKDR